MCVCKFSHGALRCREAKIRRHVEMELELGTASAEGVGPAGAYSPAEGFTMFIDFATGMPASAVELQVSAKAQGLGSHCAGTHLFGRVWRTAAARLLSDCIKGRRLSRMWPRCHQWLRCL